MKKKDLLKYFFNKFFNNFLELLSRKKNVLDIFNILIESKLIDTTL